MSQVNQITGPNVVHIFPVDDVVTKFELIDCLCVYSSKAFVMIHGLFEVVLVGVSS